MHVRSDRRYQFGLPPADLWPVLASIDRYRLWWPWLRAFDGEAFEPGACWHCVVKPPLPYQLRFRITLDEVLPGALATARVDGDIEGGARLELEPDGEGSEVRLVSWLAPSNDVLRAVAAVARPVVQLGHDWVLDTGFRQFRTRALPGASTTVP